MFFRSERRREIDLLRVSNGNNGLVLNAADYHCLVVNSAAAKKIQMLSKPRKKAKALKLKAVKEDTKEPLPSSSSQIARSTLPAVISLNKSKTTPRILRRRGNSTASTRSGTSSVQSKNRKPSAPPSLATLPPELLNNIFKHLSQSSLHALLLTAPNFTSIAVPFLYAHPLFASTYRYAQFAFTVSHNSGYADFVRNLDLSYFGNVGFNYDGELEPVAGWREFKYRSDNVHLARERMDTTGKTHPGPSPFLKSFHRTRDLPIGGVCHVLGACRNIR